MIASPRSGRRRTAGRAPPPGPATHEFETPAAVNAAQLGLRHDIVGNHGVITQSDGTLAQGPAPPPACVYVREMDEESRIRLRLGIGGFNHGAPSLFLLGRKSYSPQ